MCWLSYRGFKSSIWTLVLLFNRGSRGTHHSPRAHLETKRRPCASARHGWGPQIGVNHGSDEAGATGFLCSCPFLMPKMVEGFAVISVGIVDLNVDVLTRKFLPEWRNSCMQTDRHERACITQRNRINRMVEISSESVNNSWIWIGSKSTVLSMFETSTKSSVSVYTPHCFCEL